MLKIMWRTGEWDIRGDPLLIDHVCEQVGHKGGPFAKKTMVYKQVQHKGGPFAHKPWWTQKYKNYYMYVA